MQINSSPVKSKPAEVSPEPLLLDIRPTFARGISPCGMIDQAVAGLLPGQDLVLLAPFEPVPLYGKLEAQGFEHRSERVGDGSWKIVFARDGAAPSRDLHQGCCCSEEP